MRRSASIRPLMSYGTVKFEKLHLGVFILVCFVGLFVCGKKQRGHGNILIMLYVHVTWYDYGIIVETTYISFNKTVL